jgi:hypothetical protein
MRARCASVIAVFLRARTMPRAMVQGRAAAAGLLQLAERQIQVARDGLHAFQISPGIADLPGRTASRGRAFLSGALGGHANMGSVRAPRWP